jgi:hypothetical protein
MKALAAKMIKVIGSVSGKVSKSGYNSHNKYSYLMEKDLLDAVREGLTAHNVLITSSVEQVTKEGNLTTVRMKHLLIDADSGDTLEVWSAGQGNDGQDKGIFKAITGSNKYFLMKTFLLSGNDDPENDEDVKVVDSKHTTPTPVTKSNAFGSFKKPETEPEVAPVKKITWPKTTNKSEKVEY